MNITQWGLVQTSEESGPPEKANRYNFMLAGSIKCNLVHRHMFFAACGHLCGTLYPSYQSTKCCNCRVTWSHWVNRCPICRERGSV